MSLVNCIEKTNERLKQLGYSGDISQCDVGYPIVIKEALKEKWSNDSVFTFAIMGSSDVNDLLVVADILRESGWIMVGTFGAWLKNHIVGINIMSKGYDHILFEDKFPNDHKIRALMELFRPHNTLLKEVNIKEHSLVCTFSGNASEIDKLRMFLWNGDQLIDCSIRTENDGKIMFVDIPFDARGFIDGICFRLATMEKLQ